MIAALDALKQASPSDAVEWYSDTFGAPLPVTDATVRQAATRLARQGRIHAVPNEHGIYAMGPAPEAAALTPPQAPEAAPAGARIRIPDFGDPSPAPYFVYRRLFDASGRHVGDEVRGFIQVAIPYAGTVHEDGTITPRDATPRESIPSLAPRPEGTSPGGA